MTRGKTILIGAVLAGVAGAALFMFIREDASVARGLVLYDANCASCHGVKLEGQPDWQIAGPDGLFPAPPHDASSHTWHHSDADLIAYITLGGEGAMAELGMPFDSGMPRFEEILTASEISSILTYIESHWPERERLIQAERSAPEGG